MTLNPTPLLLHHLPWQNNTHTNGMRLAPPTKIGVTELFWSSHTFTNVCWHTTKYQSGIDFVPTWCRGQTGVCWQLHLAALRKRFRPNPYPYHGIILELIYLCQHSLTYHQVPSIETRAQYNDGIIELSSTTSISSQSWLSLPKSQVLPVAASAIIYIVLDLITTNCGHPITTHTSGGRNSKTQCFRRKDGRMGSKKLDAWCWSKA